MTSSATQKSRTNRRKATVDESDSTAAKTPKSQRSPIKKSANAKTAKSKAEVAKQEPGISSEPSAELDARNLQVTLEQAFDQTKAAGEKQSTRTKKRNPILLENHRL